MRPACQVAIFVPPSFYSPTSLPVRRAPTNTPCVPSTRSDMHTAADTPGQIQISWCCSKRRRERSAPRHAAEDGRTSRDSPRLLNEQVLLPPLHSCHCGSLRPEDPPQSPSAGTRSGASEALSIPCCPSSSCSLSRLSLRTACAAFHCQPYDITHCLIWETVGCHDDSRLHLFLHLSPSTRREMCCK